MIILSNIMIQPRYLRLQNTLKDLIRPFKLIVITQVQERFKHVLLFFISKVGVPNVVRRSIGNRGLSRSDGIGCPYGGLLDGWIDNNPGILICFHQIVKALNDVFHWNGNHFRLQDFERDDSHLHLHNCSKETHRWRHGAEETWRRLLVYSLQCPVWKDYRIRSYKVMKRWDGQSPAMSASHDGPANRLPVDRPQRPHGQTVIGQVSAQVMHSNSRLHPHNARRRIDRNNLIELRKGQDDALRFYQGGTAVKRPRTSNLLVRLDHLDDIFHFDRVAELFCAGFDGLGPICY
mmetsp:Transcript_34440/g.74457  ORF Transcript_34440/g.74457 Transcript_34440/m.74457 type:complete len:291 (+) Transcript_34440:1327-2199(+)